MLGISEGVQPLRPLQPGRIKSFQKEIEKLSELMKAGQPSPEEQARQDLRTRRCGYTGGFFWQTLWTGIDVVVSTAAAIALGALTARFGASLGRLGAFATGLIGGAAGAGAGSAVVDMAGSLVEDGRINLARASREGRLSLYISLLGGPAGVALGRAIRPLAPLFPGVTRITETVTRHLPGRIQPHLPQVPGAIKDLSGSGIGWAAVQAIDPD